MEKQLPCLRCGTQMELYAHETLQLGQTGWFIGTLDNLISGGFDVAIYICPNCYKTEFFHYPEEEIPEDRIAQVICPDCGQQHDMDDPKCPFCKHDYRK